MNEFRTIRDIEVKLVGAIRDPYEMAVASARTCYSSKGIVYPEEVSIDEKAIAIRDRIAHSTLDAGHLTTRQHAHFVFAISGVSRQFIWSFLHSHPFYNSEQVSQRYVKVKRGNTLLPDLSPDNEKIYIDAIRHQMDRYEQLIQLLTPPIQEEYDERFPARKKVPTKWKGQIDRKVFEVARYVLGVGTVAHLYHTVSALTLLRYARLSNLFETPTEQGVVVRKMLECVKKLDPLFEKEVEDPISLEQTLEYQTLDQFSNLKWNESSNQAREFDMALDGHVSKLVDCSSNPQRTLKEALKLSMNRMDLNEDEALKLLLDPKHNSILADTLNLTSLDKLSQALHHVHFTFQKKISHTADSQDQRHRTVLSSRPLLFLHFHGKPDFITPFAIENNSGAKEVYEASMEETFSSIEKMLHAGVPKENAFYLLPNAFSIRMVSSGDLHSHHHKWKMRSCYNAQEEIFRATIDEISQVKEKFPMMGEHLRAPCYLRLRAGLKPYCPEGDHFCGLPVWKYNISDYQRKSI